MKEALSHSKLLQHASPMFCVGCSRAQSRYVLGVFVLITIIVSKRFYNVLLRFHVLSQKSSFTLILKMEKPVFRLVISLVVVLVNDRVWTDRFWFLIFFCFSFSWYNQGTLVLFIYRNSWSSLYLKWGEGLRLLTSTKKLVQIHHHIVLS